MANLVESETSEVTNNFSCAKETGGFTFLEWPHDG
jgi:hypothetical protein